MKLLLKGAEHLDGKAAASFYRKTTKLVRMKLGGNSPRMVLRMCRFEGQLAGDVSILHDDASYRFEAMDQDEGSVLKSLLIQAMKTFRASSDDLTSILV